MVFSSGKIQMTLKMCDPSPFLTSHPLARTGAFYSDKVINSFPAWIQLHFLSPPVSEMGIFTPSFHLKVRKHGVSESKLLAPEPKARMRPSGIWPENRDSEVHALQNSNNQLAKENTRIREAHASLYTGKGKSKRVGIAWCPGAKTLRFQCKGCGFNPWSGN